jgi:CheY-like chemotaxis protein
MYGIPILDAVTGQIADFNPFLLEMLGYSHNEFLDAGAQGFVQKPFSIAKLSERIQEVIGG